MLATREDPRLGLHRLRLAGELTELRAADLRFSLAETQAAAARRRGSRSRTRGVALLYERTEGWAAGLRLAAISLARHPDPERFVTEFSGSERTVAGYLLAEVLERQPAEVRELLLRTSVLERVSGPLADHLTGGSGSERILQELEDANAFVTVAGRGAVVVSLPPPVRRPAAARAAADRARRSSARCTGRRPGGSRSTGDVVEAIRHAQAARDWPLAVAPARRQPHRSDPRRPHGDGPRSARARFRTTWRRPTRSSRSCFAIARLLRRRARRERARTSIVAERLADTVPAERRLRFDVLLAERDARARALARRPAAVLEAMRSVEAALAAQPAGERALSDDLRALALHESRESPSCGPRGWTTPAATSSRRSRWPAGPGGPSWRSAASATSAIAGPSTGQSLSAGLELSRARP